MHFYEAVKRWLVSDDCDDEDTLYIGHIDWMHNDKYYLYDVYRIWQRDNPSTEFIQAIEDDYRGGLINLEFFYSKYSPAVSLTVKVTLNEDARTIVRLQDERG